MLKKNQKQVGDPAPLKGRGPQPSFPPQRSSPSALARAGLVRGGEIGGRNKIGPEWITGFCDRSACFSITLALRATGRWDIRPEFLILVNARHKKVLEVIKGYFGVGTIFHSGKNAGYRVGSVKELLSVIIPHFIKYPLLSTKACTFTLWSKAIHLMHSGSHKTDAGFREILAIHAGINRGPSAAVKTHFPDLKPALLPSYSLTLSPEELSEWWISGYFTIYCNLGVDFNPHGLKNSYYDRVVPSFNFSRSIAELPIITLLASYFEVTPNLRSDGLRADVNIYGLNRAIEIVNLFGSYPLLSCKQDEFKVWAQIVNDLESLQHRSSGLSLTRYMQHFFDLGHELDIVRKRNNS